MTTYLHVSEPNTLVRQQESIGVWVVVGLQHVKLSEVDEPAPAGNGPFARVGQGHLAAECLQGVPEVVQDLVFDRHVLGHVVQRLLTHTWKGGGGQKDTSIVR